MYTAIAYPVEIDPLPRHHSYLYRLADHECLHLEKEEKCIASRLLTYFNLNPKLAAELQRSSLYSAVRFPNFEGISAFSVPSIILAETHVYLHEFKRSWFVIRDWWISIRLFVSCFEVRCFVIVLFSAIIDQLNLLRRFFRSFLFLSITRIKQRLPPSFEKK